MNKYIVPSSTNYSTTKLIQRRETINEDEYEEIIEPLNEILDKILNDNSLDLENIDYEKYSTIEEKQKLISETIEESLKFIQNIKENELVKIKNILINYVNSAITQYQTELENNVLTKQTLSIIINKIINRMKTEYTISNETKEKKSVKKVVSKNGNTVIIYSDNTIKVNGKNQYGMLGIESDNPTGSKEFISPIGLPNNLNISNININDTNIELEDSNGSKYKSGIYENITEEKLDINDIESSYGFDFEIEGLNKINTIRTNDLFENHMIIGDRIEDVNAEYIETDGFVRDTETNSFILDSENNIESLIEPFESERMHFTGFDIDSENNQLISRENEKRSIEFESNDVVLELESDDSEKNKYNGYIEYDKMNNKGIFPIESENDIFYFPKNYNAGGGDGKDCLKIISFEEECTGFEFIYKKFSLIYNLTINNEVNILVHNIDIYIDEKYISTNFNSNDVDNRWTINNLEFKLHKIIIVLYTTRKNYRTDIDYNDEYYIKNIKIYDEFGNIKDDKIKLTNNAQLPKYKNSDLSIEFDGDKENNSILSFEKVCTGFSFDYWITEVERRIGRVYNINEYLYIRSMLYIYIDGEKIDILNGRFKYKNFKIDNLDLEMHKVTIIFIGRKIRINSIKIFKNNINDIEYLSKNDIVLDSIELPKLYLNENNELKNDEIGIKFFSIQKECNKFEIEIETDGIRHESALRFADSLFILFIDGQSVKNFSYDYSDNKLKIQSSYYNYENGTHNFIIGLYNSYYGKNIKINYIKIDNEDIVLNNDNILYNFKILDAPNAIDFIDQHKKSNKNFIFNNEMESYKIVSFDEICTGINFFYYANENFSKILVFVDGQFVDRLMKTVFDSTNEYILDNLKYEKHNFTFVLFNQYLGYDYSFETGSEFISSSYSYCYIDNIRTLSPFIDEYKEFKENIYHLKTKEDNINIVFNDELSNIRIKNIFLDKNYIQKKYISITKDIDSIEFEINSNNRNIYLNDGLVNNKKRYIMKTNIQEYHEENQCGFLIHCIGNDLECITHFSLNEFCTGIRFWYKTDEFSSYIYLYIDGNFIEKITSITGEYYINNNLTYGEHNFTFILYGKNPSFIDNIQIYDKYHILNENYISENEIDDKIILPYIDFRNDNGYLSLYTNTDNNKYFKVIKINELCSGIQFIHNSTDNKHKIFVYIDGKYITSNLDESLYIKNDLQYKEHEILLITTPDGQNVEISEIKLYNELRELNENYIDISNINKDRVLDIDKQIYEKFKFNNNINKIKIEYEKNYLKNNNYCEINNIITNFIETKKITLKKNNYLIDMESNFYNEYNIKNESDIINNNKLSGFDFENNEYNFIDLKYNYRYFYFNKSFKGISFEYKGIMDEDDIYIYIDREILRKVKIKDSNKWITEYIMCLEDKDHEVLFIINKEASIRNIYISNDLLKLDQYIEIENIERIKQLTQTAFGNKSLNILSFDSACSSIKIKYILKSASGFIFLYINGVCINTIRSSGSSDINILKTYSKNFEYGTHHIDIYVFNDNSDGPVYVSYISDIYIDNNAVDLNLQSNKIYLKKPENFKENKIYNKNINSFYVRGVDENVLLEEIINGIKYQYYAPFLRAITFKDICKGIQFVYKTRYNNRYANGIYIYIDGVLTNKNGSSINNYQTLHSNNIWEIYSKNDLQYKEHQFTILLHCNSYYSAIDNIMTFDEFGNLKDNYVNIDNFKNKEYIEQNDKKYINNTNIEVNKNDENGKIDLIFNKKYTETYNEENYSFTDIKKEKITKIKTNKFVQIN